MNRKPSILISTPFFYLILIFLLLIILPSARFYQKFNQPFNDWVSKLSASYRELGIPEIKYSNHEASANNSLPFEKVFKNPDNSNENFFIYINTGPETGHDIEPLKKESAGGVALFRKKMIFYSSRENRENVVVFDDIKYNLSFTLNQSLVTNISQKSGTIVIIVIVLLAACWHAAGKFIWWIILSLYYSGRGKHIRGANHSLAVWILVPPTFFQVMFYGSVIPCLSCGIYYVILFVAAYYMAQSLDWKPAE